MTNYFYLVQIYIPHIDFGISLPISQFTYTISSFQLFLIRFTTRSFQSFSYRLLWFYVMFLPLLILFSSLGTLSFVRMSFLCVVFLFNKQTFFQLFYLLVTVLLDLSSVMYLIVIILLFPYNIFTVWLFKVLYLFYPFKDHFVMNGFDSILRHLLDLTVGTYFLSL